MRDPSLKRRSYDEAFKRAAVRLAVEEGMRARVSVSDCRALLKSRAL